MERNREKEREGERRKIIQEEGNRRRTQEERLTRKWRWRKRGGRGDERKRP